MTSDAADAGLPDPGVPLLLLRGLPGSGKSTLAQCLAEAFGYRHLEADFHFCSGGAYCFDPARLADAHAWCQRETFVHIAAGGRAVVANTFVRVRELAAYVGIATTLDVPFAIMELRGDWPDVHQVPPDVLTKMRSKWEALPAHLRGRTLQTPAFPPPHAAVQRSASSA